MPLIGSLAHALFGIDRLIARLGRRVVGLDPWAACRARKARKAWSSRNPIAPRADRPMRCSRPPAARPPVGSARPRQVGPGLDRALGRPRAAGPRALGSVEFQ